jgi:tRNA1Val (adenine37-N6)-methyltransferase
MLAQAAPNIHLTALELNNDAFKQATENINQSNFKTQIQTVHANFNNYTSPNLFDVIFSNPPFYENSLLSQSTAAASAKHNTTLTLANLINNANKNLNANGWLALLLPYSRHQEVLALAQSFNLYPYAQTLVRQTNAHNWFRGMYIFSKTKTEPVATTITIKNNTNNYTTEFEQLLKPYYLAL